MLAVLGEPLLDFGEVLWVAIRILLGEGVASLLGECAGARTLGTVGPQDVGEHETRHGELDGRCLAGFSNRDSTLGVSASDLEVVLMEGDLGEPAEWIGKVGVCGTQCLLEDVQGPLVVWTRLLGLVLGLQQIANVAQRMCDAGVGGAQRFLDDDQDALVVDQRLVELVLLHEHGTDGVQ